MFPLLRFTDDEQSLGTGFTHTKVRKTGDIYEEMKQKRLKFRI